MYKSVDLFAGIGGIRLGFDNAFGNQIKTVFVSEWDENAQKTYRANFKDDFQIAGDITKIEEKQIPSFDICLAGFPCQAFSLAGQRKGFEDYLINNTKFETASTKRHEFGKIYKENNKYYLKLNLQVRFIK